MKSVSVLFLVLLALCDKVCLSQGRPGKATPSVSIVTLQDETLEQCVRKVCAAAGASYKFEPRALDVARFARRTATIRIINVADALETLFLNYEYSRPLLEARKQGETYLITQPDVSLEVTNKTPREVIEELMRCCGSNYCVDLSAFGKTRVSVSIVHLTLSDAFAKILQEIKPTLPYRFVFRHGMYLITTDKPRSSFVGRDNRTALVEVQGLPLLDALAGVCECFNVDLVLGFDGRLEGNVFYETGPETTADGAEVGVVRTGSYTMTWHNNAVVVVPDSAGFVPFVLNRFRNNYRYATNLSALAAQTQAPETHHVNLGKAEFAN